MTTSHLIRKRREANELRVAVLPELKEIQYRLVLTVYEVEKLYGKINHGLIEWMRPIVKGYRGINLSED